MSIHFDWTKELSVGNELLDSQHKHLLESINKILDAIVFGVEAKYVEENMLVFLSDYIKEHFETEEKYMKDIGYPKLKEHKEKHIYFIKNYVKFKENFNNGFDRTKLITDIERFVGEWWVDHICKDDQEYKIFAEGKNI